MFYFKWIISILLFILLSWILKRSLSSKDKDKIERSKNIIEILAITAGALFFAFKILDGWMGVSLTIEMKAERIASTNNQDIIAVQVDLEKGDIGTIGLYDAEIRAVFPDDGGRKDTPVKLLG